LTRLDDKLLPKVLAIIEDLGKVLTFTTEDCTTINPTTGVKTTTETTVDRKGSPPDRYEIKLIDDKRILADDLVTIVAGSGLTFTPENDMKVTFDSKVFKTKNVRPMYSGESIAAFEIGLRR